MSATVPIPSRRVLIELHSNVASAYSPPPAEYPALTRAFPAVGGAAARLGRVFPGGAARAVNYPEPRPGGECSCLPVARSARRPFTVRSDSHASAIRAQTASAVVPS